MRASALSDDQVIRTINEFFIPVEVNITTDGFPHQMPAMKAVESVYQASWRFEFGFANCMVVDPEGKLMLAVSTRNEPGEPIGPQAAFSPKKYMKFMIIALERWKKFQAIQKLGPFQKIEPFSLLVIEIKSDIIKSVQAMAQFLTYLQQK